MTDIRQDLEFSASILEEIMGSQAPLWNDLPSTREASTKTQGPTDRATAPLAAPPGRTRQARAKTRDRSSAVRRTHAAIEAASYRSDKLSVLLADMAARAGFDQVVLSDGAGLPLAAYAAPSEGAVLSALASILGEALERVGEYLEKEKGESISVDVGYADKLVLRRFDFAAGTFYITVLCGQDVDERSELELSVDEIRSILEQL